MVSLSVVVLLLAAMAAVKIIQLARRFPGIPGPFIARFTEYWKVYHMLKGDYVETLCWWHQRRGPLIRIGPQTLSVGDPAEVPRIYQTTPLLLKGNMYWGLSAWYRGKNVSGVEGIMDETEHAEMKKVIGQAFSWKSVLDYEHLIDRATTHFLDISQGLEEFDMLKWIDYYTFDSMNGIAFSSDLGCMRQGTDVGGTLKMVRLVMSLWTYTVGSPIFFMWIARALSFVLGPSGPLLKLCLDRLESRTQTQAKRTHTDLLDVYLKAQQSHPEMFNREKVIGMTLTTLLTGSETTSVNLAWTIYHLLQSPSSLLSLQEELETAYLQGELSYPPSLKDLCKLPYLTAVTKEGMRCASTVQMSLERIVPPSGMEICGRYIPAGITVGCLQRVIHLNQNLYGYDAAIFRPGRWTEASEDVQKSMERCGMWFGHGKHMCLGQNFARAGMMKLLAMMLMRFDISAVDPNARMIPKVSTLGGPAGSYHIRVKPRQDVDKSTLSPVQPVSLSNDKKHEGAHANNMELPFNPGEVPKIGNVEEGGTKVADITAQLQESFSAVANSRCSYVRPNDKYHGVTDDPLTCDGICHEPRSICLDELKRVVANCTAGVAGNTGSMKLWLRMAQEALGELDKENEEIPVTDITSATSLDGLFVWSTPENAAIAMSGRDHAPLSLPTAVCWPLSTVVSSGSFHPTWIENSIAFITTQSSGCSFNSDVAVTRLTTPASRIHHVSVLTGLGIARVGNLGTGALSGLFYMANNKPENMVGNTRAVGTFFMGLAYADELACPDQGGEWSHLANLAGPLLAAERLINGPLPQLFERVLFGYHCCTVRARAPLDLTTIPVRTLFLARFYDSTLPAYLDCIKCLEPSSVLPTRATTWGTLLSNDVFDYVSDGLSGRVANLCWAVGTWDSPIECARMFRGCLIAVARTAHHAPGSLFALLYMEFTYLYSARYCYYSVPCDTNLPLDDTYIPYSVVDIPTPGATPISGFRATLRAAFSASSYDAHNGLFDPLTPFGAGSAVNTADGSLPPWQGLAATPCAWDIAHGEFDVVAMRATHDILGCLDRGVYADSPGLYRAHLGWLIRQYDSLVAAGRDNLGVGRYYVANRLN